MLLLLLLLLLLLFVVVLLVVAVVVVVVVVAVVCIVVEWKWVHYITLYTLMCKRSHRLRGDPDEYQAGECMSEDISIQAKMCFDAW